MRILIAVIASAFLAVSAQAADLGGSKDDGYAAPFPEVSMNGLYMDVGVGPSFSKVTVKADGSKWGAAATTGAIAEARLGYDFPVSKVWFLGFFGAAGYDWSSESGLENGFSYKLGGRFGPNIGNAKLFVEAGYAGRHIAYSDYSHDDTGYFVGGGAEIKFAPKAYLFARADWVKDNSFNIQGVDAAASHLDVMAGVGLRF